MSAATRNDAELVSESLSGNRDAFGQIVARYQSLVCSLAYSATGSLSQSEDLAQDTFITAWKQLRNLREPEKLRAWLCGIARNLIHNWFRRQGREPSHAAETLETVAEFCAPEPLLVDHIISREEEAILWRSLERIPEIYREPLILFYREHQSVEAVAQNLELSGDAVKQRLSRGRELLHEQVLAFVEGALERTNPGKAFTVGVLMALPVLTISAKAATAGVTAAKGGATAKAAAATGVLGALFGSFLMIFGNYVAYRMRLDAARSDREREFIKHFYGRLWACIFGFGLAFVPVMLFASKYARTHPLLITALIGGLSGVYTLAIIVLSVWSMQERRKILAEFGAQELTTASTKPVWEYRSQFEWLGLPLVHIQIGGGLAAQRKPVKAWFAAGRSAVGGLFAFGGTAIAPVSLGACAIGLLPFGGLAVGLIPVGGLGLGVWAFGGMALGWQAYGGCALAWNAAAGGAAIARDYAIGSFACAVQANNEIAWNFIKSLPWFRYSEILVRYIIGLQLLWVVPLVFWWWMIRRAHSQEELDGQ
ncbi:MAG: RNA polymerase sigma factor [Verrucomicrobiota bacterium]|jgi:RNA polymerase sigma factor (sigma-70 family)